MAAPTTLVISYGTSSTATLPIPTLSAGSVGGVSQPTVLLDVTTAIRNIFFGGGFYLPGTSTWVPYGQITLVTPQ